GDQPDYPDGGSSEGTLKLLNGTYTKLLVLLLVAQGGIFYAVAMRPEQMPPVRPLNEFPRTVGAWNLYRESEIEPDVQDVLKADDPLVRLYVKDRVGAYLFVAFFKTQREGQSPHSPKNCLPAAGFEPIESDPIDITVPGRTDPIHVNRFLTARGEEKSVTLY